MRANTVRFEGFEYRPEEQCLLYQGKRLAVGSRALALLAVLLGRPGTYIPAVELVRAAWPSTFVDDSNLRVQLAALRRHLTVADRDLIQNAPGRGYAFVGLIDSPPPEEVIVTVSISIALPKERPMLDPAALIPALGAALSGIVTTPARVHSGPAGEAEMP